MKKTLATLLAMVSLTAIAQQQQLFYPSGTLQYSYTLKNDKLNGSFASYHDNGLMKVKGNFIDGKKTGVWQVWDSDGVLRTKRSYDNATVDLLGEWSKTGCHVDQAYLDGKENIMNSGVGFKNYDDIFYSYRYWRSIAPVKENEDLFSSTLINYFKTELSAGRMVAFSDDRFVTPLQSAESVALLENAPAAFIIKEDHTFSLADQASRVRVLGLGLCYGEGENKKTAWLYFPDLRTTTSALAKKIVAKIENDDFLTSIDRTTFTAKSWDKPIKPSDNDMMYLRLAEIDKETSCWVYLLDKDLASRR